MSRRTDPLNQYSVTRGQLCSRIIKGRRKKSGSLRWYVPLGEGGPGHTFLVKKYHFLFCFYLIQKLSKRVKTIYFFITLRVLPFLEVFQYRLSSRLSVQALNNFKGITGNKFNFLTRQLFLHIRGF